MMVAGMMVGVVIRLILPVIGCLIFMFGAECESVLATSRDGSEVSRGWQRE